MTWLVDRCLRHPLRVAALSLLLLVLAVFGLTQLGTSAAIRTLTGSGSAAYRADREVADRFGDESILVLVPATAREIALTADLGRVIGLEGCLAGTAKDETALPGGAKGPCARLRQLKPAKVVYGPGTFINAAVGQVSDEIERLGLRALTEAQQAKTTAEAAARKRGAGQAAIARAGQAASDRVLARSQALLQVAQSRGINVAQPPTLSDTAFVERLLFDANATPAGTPKARYGAVFPSADAGLITLRLRSDLSEADRREAVELVQQAVGLSDLRLSQGKPYVVSGSPVLVAAVADELASALLALLAVGVLVMALVLALTFPERRRLLPLGLALGTVAVVFGGIGLLGMSINLGTIATLPVLLGLAVDYGVQLHARVEEARRSGLSGTTAVRTAVARGDGRCCWRPGRRWPGSWPCSSRRRRSSGASRWSSSSGWRWRSSPRSRSAWSSTRGGRRRSGRPPTPPPRRLRRWPRPAVGSGRDRWCGHSSAAPTDARCWS